MKETWDISSSISVRSTPDSKWSKSVGYGVSSPILHGVTPSETYSDVILWQNSIPDDYPVFYLTDSQGNLILDSTPKFVVHHISRGLTKFLNQQNFQSPRIEFFPGRHIWGGWMSPEHGHLLIDHFAGYLNAVKSFAELTAVYVKSPDFLEGHVEYLMGKRNPFRNNLVIPRRECGYTGPLAKFESITVSQPSFVERTFVYDWHLANFRKGKVAEFGDRIWLSRRGESYRSVFKHHEKFEKRLESCGFSIVQPETMTIAEQVGLFSRAEFIAGIAGSAFHTLLLCPMIPRNIIYLSGSRSLCSANFPMIDRLLGNRGLYYDTGGDDLDEMARQVEAFCEG
jgi:hypothetical protein